MKRYDTGDCDRDDSLAARVVQDVPVLGITEVPQEVLSILGLIRLPYSYLRLVYHYILIL